MPIFTVKRKIMRKISLIAASVLLIGSLSGCGEKSENGNKDKGTAPDKQSKEVSAPKIKITEGVVKKSEKKEKSKANSGQFYYSYNKEKKSSESEDNKTRTTLDAYLNIHSPYERVRITLMIKKLSKDFIIRCSPCHDDYANGVIGPSLLDKNGTFIYNRLVAFKTGKRKNVLMKELVSQIDDSKLKNIADEIAAFNKQIQKLRKGKK